MASKKTIIIGLLSVIYIGAILYIVDLGQVVSVLGRIPGTALATATALIVVANLFALARSGAVLGALGFRWRWRDLFVAFSASNISNLPLNIVGQSITRAVVLVRAGIPFGVTVMATYVERLLAAGVLFVSALAGVWFLSGAIDFSLYGGAGDILTKLAGIAVVGGVVVLTALRERILARGATGVRWLVKLWPSAVLTVLCHAAGVGAYLVLLTALDPHGISAQLVAALVIVMFVTSLPISFAGWGIRELSAASALGLIGMSPEMAVAAAVAIGLLYLATTGLYGALGLLVVAARRQDTDAVLHEGNLAAALAGPSIPQDLDSRIIQGCALLCTVLLFFRFPVQFGGSELPINVNTADVVLFVALGIIVLMIAAGRIRSLFPPLLTVGLASLSGIIILGLVVSWARDDLGGWAVYTRGVGWVLMLGYAALGAAVVRFAGEAGRMLLLRSLITAALTVCALQLLMVAWSASVFRLPLYVLAYPLQGFAENQNAFSFELAVVGVLLIAGRSLGLFEARQWAFGAGVALVVAAIFLTGSRTGAVFVVVLAVVDHLWSKKCVSAAGAASPSGIDGPRTRLRPRATAVAAVAVVTAILLPYAAQFGARALDSAFGVPIDSEAVFSGLARADDGLHSIHVEEENTRLVHPSADIERWNTIVGGLGLWRESPIIGAGLGAYVQSVLAAGEPAHGIHSTYVWFLAEMGLLGLGVVVGLGVLVAAKARRMMAEPRSAPWGFSIAGILSLMAIGGLAQDFFFQRIFWFVLGFAAAVPSTRRAAGPEGVSAGADARIFLAAVVATSLIVFFLAL